MIEFVPMEAKYAQEALDVYNWYVKHSTATFNIETIDLEDMNKILFSGLTRFPSFAVLSDEVFIGYVLLNRYKPREAYDGTGEVTMYLTPEYVGKGIGSQAMTFIEKIAKKHDFRVLLSVICAENESSIALFEKFSYFRCAHFKEVGKKFDRILDIVIYEKIIG